MTESSHLTAAQPQPRSALRAIAIAGVLAGALDMAQASFLFGFGVWRVVASGLLGPAARQGGAGMYALGILLHFFIAISAAAIYYAASRRLKFLLDAPLVCGIFFGLAVDDVMSFIVLPLSALHAQGPFELRDLIEGPLVHMATVGLPIAYSMRRFAPKP